MADHKPLPAQPPAGASTEVPPGWAVHTRRSPLTQPWEPLFTRLLPAEDGQTPAVALALRVAEPHCNSRGFAHGGLVSALADNAMGLSAVAAARAEPGADVKGAVTVSLNLDFIDSARIGQWLTIEPVVLRHGRTLAFTECHVHADGQLVARASATFRLG